MKRVQVMLLGLLCFLIGALVSQHLPNAQAQEPKAKNPTWLHGMNLMSRKSNEDNFGKDTRKYGIEVFKDENNGNLIYISETGSIAVVPGK
jgi:hypothetical protein